MKCGPHRKYTHSSFTINTNKKSWIAVGSSLVYHRRGNKPVRLSKTLEYRGRRGETVCKDTLFSISAVRHQKVLLDAMNLPVRFYTGIKMDPNEQFLKIQVPLNKWQYHQELIYFSNWNQKVKLVLQTVDWSHTVICPCTPLLAQVRHPLTLSLDSWVEVHLSELGLGLKPALSDMLTDKRKQ